MIKNKIFEKEIQEIFTCERIDIIASYIRKKKLDYQLKYFEEIEKKCHIIIEEYKVKLTDELIKLYDNEKKVIIDINNQIILGEEILIKNILNEENKIQCICVEQELMQPISLNDVENKQIDLRYLEFVYWDEIIKQYSVCSVEVSDLDQDKIVIENGQCNIYLKLTTRGRKNVFLLTSQLSKAFKATKLKIVIREKEDKFNLSNKANIAYKEFLQVLLNKNSNHLLNNGNPYKFYGYVRKIKQYKNKIANNGFAYDDFVIVSSGVIGIYGMRKPTDIDMVTVENNYKVLCDNLIDCHHHVICDYERSPEEITLLPENYLYWFGVKFAALPVIACACKNRIEQTKKLDGKLIEYIYMNGKINTEQKIKLIRIKIKHYYLRHIRELKKKLDMEIEQK